MLAAVFAGGAAGGLARWGLSEWLGAGAHDGAWPWGTFVANITGALLLGIVAASLMHHPDRRHLRAGQLLGPGLCGALTTFSTLQLEVVRLVDDGHLLTGAGYLAASVAAGLCAVRLGEALTP